MAHSLQEKLISAKLYIHVTVHRKDLVLNNQPDTPIIQQRISSTADIKFLFK